jgi:glycyl-tRNA synthetase
VVYDEKDAVGRRYRRQDAAGTPFCITVDHQSLEDGTVTIRHRDTMEQQRVATTALKGMIAQEVDMKNWLMKI